MSSGEPVYGKMGEWNFYKHDEPHRDNWEDALFLSELAHAKEVKKWTDRVIALDRAYKSKFQKLQVAFEKALTEV